ncbi:MAG: kelch repeat-containing protein [Myxococcaceae bacterium]
MRGILLVGLLLTACGGLDPHAPAWTELDTSGVPGRWGHIAPVDTLRNRMLVFGGDSPAGQHNDLCAFDLATDKWSQVEQHGTPGPRTDLAGFYDAPRDRLVIIGGRIGFASSTDEVWALDFASATWKQLPSIGVARHDIPVATDGVHAWVFGGAGVLFQSLDDLWELDLATDTWKQLTEDGDKPAARTSGAFVYFQGALWLSGGHDVSRVTRDSWRYDLGTATWSKLDVEGGSAAGAHFGIAFDERCGEVVLSGGDNLDNADTAFTDALELQQKKFHRVKTSNLPPPRDHASLAVDPVKQRLILYGGGQLGDGLAIHTDAWALPAEKCP